MRVATMGRTASRLDSEALALFICRMGAKFREKERNPRIARTILWYGKGRRRRGRRHSSGDRGKANARWGFRPVAIGPAPGFVAPHGYIRAQIRVVSPFGPSRLTLELAK